MQPIGDTKPSRVAPRNCYRENGTQEENLLLVNLTSMAWRQLKMLITLKLKNYIPPVKGKYNIKLQFTSKTNGTDIV